MTITKYNSAIDVEATFENGYSTNCYYFDFKRGKVFNPFEKATYGIGYFGDGKYIADSRAYIQWTGMLKRCYSEKYLQKYPSYKDCKVCDEWLNYQNFAEWHENNYYEINNCNMQLDKDILQKGNKIYSPDTCVYLPEEINYIVLSRNSKRGKYPIGVYLHSDKTKFVAQSHDINKKMIYLGRYDTINEAFQVYKKYKEKVIKQVADKYCDLIPKKAYIALYNYNVEITD